MPDASQINEGDTVHIKVTHPRYGEYTIIGQAKKENYAISVGGVTVRHTRHSRVLSSGAASAIKVEVLSIVPPPWSPTEGWDKWQWLMIYTSGNSFIATYYAISPTSWIRLDTSGPSVFTPGQIMSRHQGCKFREGVLLPKDETPLADDDEEF